MFYVQSLVDEYLMLSLLCLSESCCQRAEPHSYVQMPRVQTSPGGVVWKQMHYNADVLS